MKGLLRSLQEKANPSHTALLVVDMQNDFCSPKGSMARMGLDVSRMASIIPAIVRLTGVAREVGVLTVFLRVIDTEEAAISAAYYEANVAFYEPYLKEGETEGTNAPWMDVAFGEGFCAPIEPKKGDVAITKHRFGAFVNTKLDQVLRSNDVKSVVVAGVMTDVCVESTARAALDHDYYVIVPEDCTATIDDERKRASLRAIGSYFGVVTSSEEIIRIWQNG